MIELRIPKDEIEYWNRLMDMHEVDLEAERLDEDAKVASWTVDFGDGIEADLNVYTTQDKTLWCEMVWFSNGVELTCSDVSYSLDGEWGFEGPDYSVNVVAVV